VNVRFAPSPTGDLHLGHAFSALLNWEHAQTEGVPFLLRHEDIDATRVRPQFYDSIEQDLHWLALDWPTPARRQSQHLDEYAGMIARLADLEVIYPCFKTRKDIAEAAASAPQAGAETAAPLLARTCEQEAADRLAAGESFAWRFDPRAAADHLDGRVLTFDERDRGRVEVDPFKLGSVILGRKDAPASYHVCVVHDDAAQEITTVIRGEDLLDSTHVHVTLQALLGLPTPFYHHHRLILDTSGKRLAKRHGAMSLASLRAKGATPASIRAMVNL
jgi:glutamyl-Q tRNA(Asp) synthetase